VVVAGWAGPSSRREAALQALGRGPRAPVSQAKIVVEAESVSASGGGASDQPRRARAQRAGGVAGWAGP
jgi:hypothetical protein